MAASGEVDVVFSVVYGLSPNPGCGKVVLPGLG
jgi:hypothetical protein